MICLTDDKIYDPQQMIKIKEENQNNEMKQSMKNTTARGQLNEIWVRSYQYSDRKKNYEG